jgi:hypothetical protein
MQLSKPPHVGEDEGFGVAEGGAGLGAVLGLVLAGALGDEPGVLLAWPAGLAEGRAAPLAFLAAAGVVAGSGFLPDLPAPAPAVGAG